MYSPASQLMDGRGVGTGVGDDVGAFDGTKDGRGVGRAVGENVGALDGSGVGALDGNEVGVAVGCSYTSPSVTQK